MIPVSTTAKRITSCPISIRSGDGLNDIDNETHVHKLDPEEASITGALFSNYTVPIVSIRAARVIKHDNESGLNGRLSPFGFPLRSQRNTSTSNLCLKDGSSNNPPVYSAHVGKLVFAFKPSIGTSWSPK